MTLLSMNEVTTFRWSLEEDIENYQEAGYEAIGVWRHKLSDYDDDEAVAMLGGSGLNVSNLLWAGGFTGSDGRSFEEGVEDAAYAVRMAAALEAGCLVIYPGGRNNHTYRHAGRLLRTALEELLPLAEASGVPLAIKPRHPACAAEWTFLTSIESVVQLIEEFCSPFLKLAYDTYYFPFGCQQKQMLLDLAPHIGIVHLGDRQAPPSGEQERCLLGHGRLPLGQIITTLQEAGYTGAFDVKLLGPEIETLDYWTILEQSQLAFQELAQVAAPRSLT